MIRTFTHRTLGVTCTGSVRRGVLILRPVSMIGHPLGRWPHLLTMGFKWPERQAAVERVFEMSEEASQ